MAKTLNELADECYDIAKTNGFHSEEPNLGNYISNLHSEVSELWEAYRGNKLFEKCDKAHLMEENGIEQLNNAEEEIADIIIRVLDTAKVLNIDIDKAVKAKSEFNKTRPYRHGNKLT